MNFINNMTKTIVDDIQQSLDAYLKPYNDEVKSSKICFTHEKYCGYFRGKVLGFQAFASNIQLSNTNTDFRIMFDPELNIILEMEDTKEIKLYELSKIKTVFWRSCGGKSLSKGRYLNIF